jgi:hypothetical protein
MAGTLVANTINTDTGLFSTQNAYNGIAKAWVAYTYFSSTVAITKSFNISSVTRTGTGRYYADFTTAMPDANYATVGSGSVDPSASAFTTIVPYTTGTSPYYTAPTTTRFYWSTSALSTGGGLDSLYGFIAVFD